MCGAIRTVMVEREQENACMVKAAYDGARILASDSACHCAQYEACMSYLGIA